MPQEGLNIFSIFLANIYTYGEESRCCHSQVHIKLTVNLFLLSLTTHIFTSTLRSVVNGCEPLNQVGPMSQWSKSNGMNVIGDSSQVKSNCLVCAGGKSEIVKRLPQKVKVKGTVT